MFLAFGQAVFQHAQSSLHVQQVGKRIEYGGKNNGPFLQFGILREISHVQIPSLVNPSSVRVQPPRHEVEERRLSASVSPDQSDAGTRFHLPGQTAQHRVGPIGLVDVFELNQRHFCSSPQADVYGWREDTASPGPRRRNPAAQPADTGTAEDRLCSGDDGTRRAGDGADFRNARARSDVQATSDLCSMISTWSSGL